MKLVTAFLRLIRWPNLVFIVVTQCLFYYLITLTIFNNYTAVPVLSEKLFWFIVVSSVFIAAAGYIINDYFDLNIDRVNKPDKLVVEKIIKRRWAIVWHLVLSFAGLVISTWVCIKMFDWHTLLAGTINLLCVIALWLYSTNYKRQLLIGNILISLLTAWTILILYVINTKSWFMTKIFYDIKHNYDMASTKLFKYAVLYAGFAFIISLIREVIKDMEDMEGDAKYGCKTMPIVWGIPATKVFTAVWLIVAVAALVIIQVYALYLGWWWSAAYCVVTIIIPLLWILRKLYKAQVAKDYHQLSTAIKLVMLAGILSMVFIKIYS
ncbi:geranylgeranylglycerol-phosphate geranylgeranyltransferase [Ferruginibacter sp.]|nr:geranylgeranylglycerol-phosphate geranylgeranyltransferase [Ferruginibacter sp.]